MTDEGSLQKAMSWLREVKKFNLTVTLFLLAFHPQKDKEGKENRDPFETRCPANELVAGKAASAEAGKEAANLEGILFLDLGKLTADEESLDASFETVVEHVLDTKGPLSPGKTGLSPSVCVCAVEPTLLSFRGRGRGPPWCGRDGHGAGKRQQEGQAQGHSRHRQEGQEASDPQAQHHKQQQRGF